MGEKFDEERARWEEMRDHILRNEVGEVERMLNEGFDPSGNISHARTALVYAAEIDKTDICRLLVERGADVNSRQMLLCGETYFSALHIAAKRGKADTCRVLLDAGANPNAVALAGDITPLHLIVEQGAGHREWVDIVQLLLDAGANPNAMSGRYWEAHDKLNKMKKEGRGFDNYENIYVTPLHAALHTSNKIEENPVEVPHLAEWGSGTKVVELLLRYGADPGLSSANPPTDYLTPLQLALKSGHENDALVLLNSPAADLGQRTVTGRTLRQVAAKRPEIQKLLMSMKTAKTVEDAISVSRSKELAPKPIGRQNVVMPL